MTPLLNVSNLYAGYAGISVLHGVSFVANPGEIVAIVGSNGAGKTTLLSAIAGVNPATAGTVTFKDADITARPAYLIPGSGLVLVPEGGRLFPFMTVEENLELGAYSPGVRKDAKARLGEVMDVFPILRERRTQLAGRLSGGERQMCAIARAMMTKPTLLMLDEPSVGLSPLMVGRVFEIVETLARRDGLTIVLVEQNVSEALEIADRAYVLDRGEFTLSGSAAELRENRTVQETYMGV